MNICPTADKYLRYKSFDYAQDDRFLQGWQKLDTDLRR